MTPDTDTQLHRPIAVGFLLLSVPLWISILLAENVAGAWANAAGAAVMAGLGLLLWGKRS